MGPLVKAMHMTRQTCFHQLQQLQKVRYILGRKFTAQLAVSLVKFSLEYCAAVRAGLPKATTVPLQ
jgi:hypothetical protein